MSQFPVAASLIAILVMLVLVDTIMPLELDAGCIKWNCTFTHNSETCYNAAAVLPTATLSCQCQVGAYIPKNGTCYSEGYSCPLAKNCQNWNLVFLLSMINVICIALVLLQAMYLVIPCIREWRGYEKL